jgi:nucleotide-binding universal stress UspA family protein
MTSVTQILVPLDGSSLAEQALPYAQSLVGASGRITLLRVFRDPAPMRDAAGVEIVPEDLVGDWLVKDSQRYLDETAASFRSTLPAGIEVDTFVASGDAAGVILRTAADRGCELIVMTSHARGAIGRAAYGSVADRIARTADIPVVVVRPHGEDTAAQGTAISRIIVPLDRSKLAKEALPVAKAMALHLDASIHLVHVIDTFSSYMAINGMPVSQSMIDEWYAETSTELEAAAAEMRAAGVATTAAIYQGSTVANICEIAQPGDLIVMTSHGRSGFSRWFLGSIAEKLVRLAPVPVCLVPARHEAPDRSEAIAREMVVTAFDV